MSRVDRCPLRVIVRSLVGDCSVLCAIVVVRGRASIVVNERYDGALDHARQHLERGDSAVWICSPDCPGER